MSEPKYQFQAFYTKVKFLTALPLSQAWHFNDKGQCVPNAEKTQKPMSE